jgi:hypothetical protein
MSELDVNELSITNTGAAALQFGVGTEYVRPASYSPNPDVELALPGDTHYQGSIRLWK